MNETSVRRIELKIWRAREDCQRALDMLFDGLEPVDDGGADLNTLDRLNMIRKTLKGMLRADQRKLL